MTRQLAIIALLLGVCTAAHAQALVDLSTVAPPGTAGSLSISSFDPTDATSPISVVEGKGWKVGEGTVIHPTFGVSTGFDSNVFYENSNTQAAGVMRLIGQVAAGSLSIQRLHPGEDPMAGGMGDAKPDRAVDQDEGMFQYWASARLTYDQMLSGNDTVNQTGGLGAGILLRGLINPQGNWSGGLDENFARMIRAASFETSQNMNRDVNTARVALYYHPHEHSLGGYLYYHNTIDVIENNANMYPDRMFHRFGVHPEWVLLPVTKLYGDLSIGAVTGIGNSAPSAMKPTAYPLLARIGIATLLNLRTTVNVAAGYTNGFYSAGPSYSAASVDSMIAFRYSALGRVGAGYSLDYEDSLNANYYRDHVIRGFISQDFAPFVALVSPELHFRQYQGLYVAGNSPVRDDTIVAVVAGIHYVYRDWLAAVLDYRFSTVDTAFRYTDAMGQVINPSYTRHELLLGIRLAI